MPNTIKLKKFSDIQEEYTAGGAITPGMLVAFSAADTVVAHNAAATEALPMFALEDELQGKGIDDAYAADDPVQVWVAGRGDEVYAWLAVGETAAVGTRLVSNGDGTLRAWDSGTPDPHGVVVALALEAVDNAGGSAAVRIRVKVL